MIRMMFGRTSRSSSEQPVKIRTASIIRSPVRKSPESLNRVMSSKVLMNQRPLAIL